VKPKPVPSTGAPDSLGWIKLYRQILDHRLWQLPPGHFKVAIALLLLAGHRPRRFWNGRAEIPLDAGELLTSQETLAGRAGKGVTRRVVQRALPNLSRIGFAEVRRSPVGALSAPRAGRDWCGRGIVVRVLNWERYQGANGEAVPIAVPKSARRGAVAVHKQEGKNGSTWIASRP
jgi:hypothetical protein